MQINLLILCLLGAVTVPHSEAGGQKTKPGPYPKGGGRRTTTVAPPEDRAQKMARASNNFSQRLYPQIVPASGNLIYSPSSIHQALSMTSLGGGGDTKTEMISTLGLGVFPVDREAHEAYGDVIEKLDDATNETIILIANAIFINKEETIESTFVIDVQTFYRSDVSTFDPNDPAGPETVVNAYVRGKTRGVIQNLVPPNVINRQTKLVLVNTIYFNGSWAAPFPKDRTQLADFHTQQGIIQVDTMFDTRTMNIKRNVDGADVGELTIRGGRFSVVLVLPHTVDGLAYQESVLNKPGRFEQLLEGLTPVRVNVSMPKVDIRSTLQLSEPLKRMGMVKAFSQRDANFTKIDRNGGLFIGAVIHQAMVNMTEDGVVAAAATTVLIQVTSLPPPPTGSFLVNKPFLFVIYDKFLKLILFQGRCTEP